MVAFFPIVLGVLLVVPNTIARFFYLFKVKKRQTPSETIVLNLGVIVTLISFFLFVDLFIF